MDIVYSLINVVIFILCAPFFEGVIRKLTAKVQSRQGPPVFQPYYDILKLLGKNSVNSAGNWSFKLAPLMAFASIVAVVFMIPFGYQQNVAGRYGDIITVVYLLTLGGVSVLLGALSSKNTFAMVGASREMVTMIMVEPVLAMTLILGAVKFQSLALSSAMFNVSNAGYSASIIVMLVVYLMALQAFVGRQPFDISEAEIEILEGPFIEYSGPNYALFKYYMMIKQMFYAFLFVSVFTPFVDAGSIVSSGALQYVLNMVIQLAEILVVFVFISLIGSTNPRLRIDQAAKFYAVLIIISICAVGLSVRGF